MSYNQLLHTPEGVRDLYGSECRKKTIVMNELQKVIGLYGYEEIQTPTFEFFDVFSREIGTIPSKELFKFFDKENNTLVLRPDFTPSIARCAAKYFAGANHPLRFTYSGSAFQRTSSLQGKLMETTQLGAELIGDASVYADAEMIAMTLQSLCATGLKSFRVCIGHMEFFKGLCAEAGIDDATELELRDLISGKNFFAARSLLSSQDIPETSKENLLKITEPFPDLSSLSAIKETLHNDRSIAAISRLEELYRVLDSYGLAEYVSFDLGMLSKYNYYTGVIFRVYTYGVGNAIAKGGRYDKLLSCFGSSAPSIGFALYVDDLLEALSRQDITIPDQDGLTELTYNAEDFNSYKEALEEAKRLRSEGKKVLLSAK